MALQDALSDFCRVNHIKNLCLFGSHLNGTAGPGNDVDLSRYFRDEIIASAEERYAG